MQKQKIDKKEDLTGKEFGRLLILRFHEIRKGKTFWWCVCDCGKEVSMRADAMKQGRTISCGCWSKEVKEDFQNLRGQIFGRLRVLKVSSNRKCGQISWLCKCVCGNEVSVRGDSLRSGHAKSCGCLQRTKAALHAQQLGKANRRHGMTHSPEWRAWRGMRQRCLDEATPQFSAYGGRGICICERWESFDNFLEDMGRKPTPGHSLERIDVNGNYEPENCRWATWTEQHRNKRSNVTVTYQGKTQCLTAWAEEYKIAYPRLYQRLKRGWSFEKSLTAPVNEYTKKHKR